MTTASDIEALRSRLAEAEAALRAKAEVEAALRAKAEAEAALRAKAEAEAALRAKAEVEAALRESEALRRIALEGGRMGTWRWDLRDRLIWGDAAFLALWGFPPSGSAHPLSAFTDRMSAQGRSEMADMVTRAIANGEAFDGLLEVAVGPTRGRWVRWRGVAERTRSWIVDGVSFDATQERQFDERLRASEARQAFLLKLSDALRSITAPGEIQRVAARLLGAHLGAVRALYAEVAEDGGRAACIVLGQYVRDGDPLPDRVPYRPFAAGFVDAALRLGERVIVADAGADPRFGERVRRTWLAEGIVALVAVPHREDGRVVGLFGVHDDRPRAWTPAEVTLIAEVAERTWEAAKRTRAESALRESEARFRQFAEASSDVLWIRDATTLEWEYLSPAFEAIYGLSVAEALTGDTLHNWTDLIVEEDRAHAMDSIQRVREGAHAIFEYRVRRPDGALRWLRNTDFPMRDPGGAVERIGGVGQDVTELKRVEAALRDSEGRLRTLMEGIPQLVWRSRDQGAWTWAGPQWLAFTGQSQEASHGLGWLDVVHPDDRSASLRAWDEARPRGTLDTEFRVRRARDGAYLWHHTRSVPVRDALGRIVEWLGTTTDIDALRRLQEKQTVMVAELQHRTRNLIAVVRSIAQQTMAQTGPGEAFREQFNDRLGALSRVQGLLSRSQNEPITIGHLVRLELDALGAKSGARVVLDGPEVLLRPSVVQTLALALHELATNARKYGALRTARGRLAVRWSVNAPEGDDRRLVLEWTERGIAPPEADRSSRRGYGRELIERALPYALQARTLYELGDTELRCRIELPLTDRTRKANP